MVSRIKLQPVLSNEYDIRTKNEYKGRIGDVRSKWICKDANFMFKDVEIWGVSTIVNGLRIEEPIIFQTIS